MDEGQDAEAEKALGVKGMDISENGEDEGSESSLCLKELYL